MSSRPTFSFAKFEQQARATVAHAEARAQQIIIDAEDQIRAAAESRRRAAHEAGLHEGRQAGLEQIKREARAAAIAAAQDELSGLIQTFTSGLAEFERQKRSLVASAESGLIELALAIARRVCKTHVAESSAPARANIRALLELVKHDADLELHVNPAERDLLDDVARDFVQGTAELEHVTVVANPAVDRGGCVLRTRDGTIDASVSGQLERIADALCGREAATPTAEPGTER